MSKLEPFYQQLRDAREKMHVKFQSKGKYNAVDVLQELISNPKAEGILDLYADPNFPNKAAGEITKFFGRVFPGDRLEAELVDWQLTLPDGTLLSGKNDLVHQKVP